jgi:hypothetical protein
MELFSIHIYYPKGKIECSTVDRFRMPLLFLSLSLIHHLLGSQAPHTVER